MTYQEAIKILKAENFCYQTTTEECDKISYCTDCKGFNLREEGAKANEVAIKALEKAEKYRWIPCSERLPTKNGKYYVCYFSRGNEAWLIKDKIVYTTGDWYEDHFINIHRSYDVLAWREIEPFEEGDEE